MKDIEKIGAVVALIVTICTILITFGIEVQKINQVVSDVAELKFTQQQMMLAIGNAEAQRWRAAHPKH